MNSQMTMERINLFTVAIMALIVPAATGQGTDREKHFHIFKPVPRQILEDNFERLIELERDWLDASDRYYQNNLALLDAIDLYLQTELGGQEQRSLEEFVWPILKEKGITYVPEGMIQLQYDMQASLMEFAVSQQQCGNLFRLNPLGFPGWPIQLPLHRFEQARLGGVFPIRDLKPSVHDDNFDFLASLGEPLEVDHQIHEGIGENMYFIYDDFKIYYGGLSQPEYQLMAIEFSSPEAELVFEEGQVLKIQADFSCYLKAIDPGQQLVKIHIPEDHGMRILITQQDGIINGMKFRFEWD